MSSPPKEPTPTKEAADLKGGHAPAVKVGGVRIVQHKQPPKEDTTPKEKEEEEETKPNPNDERKVIISGVVAKGDKDFPPEAVKSFHDKPVPVHQQHAVHQPNVTSQHHINQPRKF